MGTRRRRVSVIYFISKLVKWDDLHMEIISNPTQVEIKKAAQALKDGHLVAFPTETVYGLGADATNENAVSRVYSVKGRPTDHPLIVHVSSINQLGKWAIDIPEYAIKLAEEFWPGPLTLILKRSGMAKDFITGGQDTVALRIPSEPIAVKLISEFEKMGGVGVAAPSANRFGAVSATTAKAVSLGLSHYLGKNDQILDGGLCEIGLESTIVSCLSIFPEILRPGKISRIQIEQATKLKTPIRMKNSNQKFSGDKLKHYSPRAEVVINESAKPGDAFFALAEIPTPTGAVRLGSPETMDDFARMLYTALRSADERSLSRVFVRQPVGDGIAIAIRDRLMRASRGQ
jgi:L-threonylcarbamoyladenylate synthase